MKIGSAGSSTFYVNSYRESARVLVESVQTPISLQASRKRLKEFKAELADAISAGCDFIFTHDVEVTMCWFSREEDRYQSHIAADLDNVIKPLLDAATGRDGIMVDDNQIQSIRASWAIPAKPGVEFSLEFKSLSQDDIDSREGVAFVEFEPSRCYRLPSGRPDTWPTVVETYQRILNSREKLLASGIEPGILQALSPIARPWHRQRLRLQGFEVISATEF